MTTKVLVVNHGPMPVEVIEMNRSAQDAVPDSPSPNTTRVVQPQNQEWFYVHSYAYLQVKEKQ